MFWNYFNNRFAKIVQNATVDELVQLLDSERKFPEKAQKALILRENEDEMRCYFVRNRTLSDANQVLLIEHIPSQIFTMLSRQSVCDKAAELIVQQGNSDNIFLLLSNQSVSDKLQKTIVERGISEEIIAMLSHSRNISQEVAEAIVVREVDKEIKLLSQEYCLPQRYECSIIARGIASEQTSLIKQGLTQQESVSMIIECGHHEAIMALLQTLDWQSPVHLNDDDRDNIIRRDNPEEIKAFFDNGWLPTETAIIHLIDAKNYDYVAKSLMIDCRGYNPFTYRIINYLLCYGDEFTISVLLRKKDVVLHQLKLANKTQEWLENKILERGNKDEIAQLARIYKVSDYTVREILRRNVPQEIKALIKGKNISDEFVVDLIDHQQYELLENYSRYVLDNPSLYLLVKYIRTHS